MDDFDFPNSDDDDDAAAHITYAAGNNHLGRPTGILRSSVRGLERKDELTLHRPGRITARFPGTTPGEWENPAKVNIPDYLSFLSSGRRAAAAVAEVAVEVEQDEIE